MRLKNKIVLVTGSTTGIGKAIALRCVAEGASVIIHGLERDLGEQVLAEAVRAVARLPRARALVLAGALMGGDIEHAVREVRARGLLVISLNMAGSVPDAADLVVSDPIQAGVMAVMAIADTAQFQVSKLKKTFY